MTEAQPNSPAPLSEQELKSRLAYSHNLMRAYGSILTVLARSAEHRARSLAELEAVVVPAITSGQFSLA
jgi:hemolysin-activating ACP:hemolysin acyltransferase